MALAQTSRNTYDWNEATHEAYWYAVYNVQALLTSGMGIPLSIPEELLSRFSQEAGLLEQEISPLQQMWIAVPYASGDSGYAQSQSLKWAEEKMDRTITSEAVAWMIISAGSQAKQLEHLYKTGIAQTGDTRLRATMLGYLASEVARFAYANLRAPQSQLYVRAWKQNVGISDPDLRPLDQVWMLWALSELDTLAKQFSFYRGSLSPTDVEAWAAELFHAITSYQQSHSDWLNLNPHDTGMLLEGISSYAATLSNSPILEDAVDLIRNLAQSLKEQVKKLDAASNGTSPLANAAEAIRALIIAQRLTGDSSLRQTALEAWAFMRSLWDEAGGVYRLQTPRPPTRQAPYEYTLREIGAVVGAFAALIYGAEMADAKAPFAQFFQSTFKTSGLMLAEGVEAGGDADMDEVPSPGKAGGPFGRAPVFASILQYEASTHRWFLMNTRFNTAGALYLASRLLWIGQREALPFMGPPRFGLPESKEAQFVSLRQQVSELGSDRTLSTEVEAIRQLLIALEGRLEELRKIVAQESISSQGLQTVEAKLSSLEQKVNTELASVNQKLTALESRIAAPAPSPTRGRFTLPDALTVVLILFILVLGFIAYQRVLQQRQPA